ncbi:mannose-6-phosphate isomerase, class I [Borreliella lusitaniae]|uniref:mannose-6-phosphate isomerase n=1 Tax=Borreliella lusitaniae TaxID=100177 RepID=A0ABZ0CHC7_9SPIR|nr:mannose-6-phosphate isomerase, class I [Borreliella lusitaniae]WNY68615.1 mannose-6-phosphate isomerase, class I [Borreliella lusitaniae]
MNEDNIFLMKNNIKEYDWGGISFIPDLLGNKIDGIPKAEMWLGAHKTFSSKILHRNEYVLLSDFLEDHKELLGGNGEFPFLFKVLSANKPLSIQIHPSKDIALKGYESENNKGIDINDPKRIYKDKNPKIELIYALSDFYALKGFLPLDEIKKICEILKLNFDFQSHREFVKTIFDLQTYELEKIIEKILKNLNLIDDFRSYWFNEIYNIYGVDVGLLVFLGMNILKLKPGEVFYTNSQEVHAYLKGDCIELMTNSDNVIRAGLTTKYIDKEEMLRVGQFEEGKLSFLNPDLQNNFSIFRLPNTNLKLIQKKINETISINRNRAMVLLVLDGRVSINKSVDLNRGESVFIGRKAENLFINGDGQAFIAGFD